MANKVTRSLVLEEFTFDGIKIRETPLKKMEACDVHISVEYCGINFADVYTVKNIFLPVKLPYVLGMEISGRIVAVGNEVVDFKVGDIVAVYQPTGGMFSKDIIINQNCVYKLDNEEWLVGGAAVPAAFLTAHIAIFELGNANSRSNQKILIHGVAGGVGMAAVALIRAKLPGSTIIGTCSNHKHDAMKTKDIDFVINYENWETKVLELFPKGVDLVIDPLAGENTAKSLSVLAHLGSLVVIGASSVVGLPEDKRRSILTNCDGVSLALILDKCISVAALNLLNLQNKCPLVRDIFHNILQLFKDGRIKVEYDKSFPFEQAASALQYLADRKNTGKVILKL